MMKTNIKPLPRLMNISAVSGMLMRSVLVTICGIVLMATSQAGAILVDLEPFNVDESFNKSMIDIYVEITEDDDKVRFEFHNDSIMDSTIKGIYFEEGVLDGIAGFVFGSNILYNETENPGNLPGGNSLSNDFETAYSAIAMPPAPFNGINPNNNETITIIMNLDTGATFEDLIEQINDMSLRIGAHVIALPDGTSFSAICVPPDSVPEPSTVAILGVGSLFLIKRKKKAA